MSGVGSTLSFGLTAVLAFSVFMAFAGPVLSGEIKEGTSPQISELAERIEKARPIEAEAIISSLIEENRGDFPLIEDSLVTFVYHGRVGVRANVPSDLNRWDTKAHQMHRLGETELYYLTLKLPLDARIDYKFYVDGLWMLDALNSKTVRGGFGDNSAFNMPRYEDPWEIAYVDSIVHGEIKVHEFESNIIVGSRQIQVYLPSGYEGGSGYPVIFVQDGGEYITLGSMVNVLDNLIDGGSIPPIVAVFIDPVGRNYEYWLNKDYEKMLIGEILPFIRENYDVSEDPEKTAIMGASLGGAISVMIAMDHPEVFGRCGSQSGAFEVNDGELLKRAEQEPKKAVDFYLDCGSFGDLLEENRGMKDVLTKKKHRVAYHEFNEGHSWGNWRAHIGEMLVFFWGKPVD